MEKMREASAELDILNAKLIKQKIIVDQKTEACTKLVDQIKEGELRSGVVC